MGTQNPMDFLNSIAQFTGGGENGAGMLGLMQLTGSVEDLDRAAFGAMPQDMQQLISDHFSGKPSKFSNFIGGLGLNGMQVISNEPGATKLREAMLASGTLAENEWGQTVLLRRDTIVSGMMSLQDQPEKLAMIQRSIASQGGRGIAALTAAMKGTHTDQDSLWDAMENDPANAGKILLERIPANQLDPEVAALSVTQTASVSPAQLQATTDRLDALRESLPLFGKERAALADLHEGRLNFWGSGSELAMTLSVLPASAQEQLIDRWKNNPSEIIALQDRLKENPDYLSIQMAQLQSNPENAAEILSQSPEDAQRNAMIRAAVGSSDPAQIAQSFLSRLPPEIRGIGNLVLGYGEYGLANVPRMAQMGGAFAEELASGGSLTSAGAAARIASLTSNQKPFFTKADEEAGIVVYNADGSIKELNIDIKRDNAPAPQPSADVRTADISAGNFLNANMAPTIAPSRQN